jgi:Fic family protein
MAMENYVPYSSLESIIENSKDAYYLALRQTQGTLKNDQPNWHPWILFFLKSLVNQKQRLELKVEKEKLVLGNLPELSLTILTITKSRGRTTISDLVTLTNANRNTIKKHLENLVRLNLLNKHGVKKSTWYNFVGI